MTDMMVRAEEASEYVMRMISMTTGTTCASC